jgi:hypothetical protein
MRLRISLDKEGNKYIVDKGTYTRVTDEELEKIKQRLEEKRKARQKELDRLRDNGWSASELRVFYRKCSQILETELICDYCNALGYCKYFDKLFRIVAIEEKLDPSNSEIIGLSESSRIKLLRKMDGCCKKRLRQHCIRKYNLFNRTPQTEVIDNSKPTLEDYLVQ